jgi:hypothetical protein
MIKISNKEVISQCCKKEVLAGDENGVWAYKCSGCGEFCEVIDKPKKATKEIAKKSTPVEIILGGEINVGEDDENYKKLKALGNMKDEKITVTDKMSGKSKEMVLVRSGTKDRDVAMTLLDADMPRERKDAIIAQYLFERGKEQGSFLMELFLSKGTHTKETRMFKKQMRFDFEQFTEMFVLALHNMARIVREGIDGVRSAKEILRDLSDRFESCANTIVERTTAIAQQRMAEKGFGTFVDKNGKVYSIFDKEVDEIIKKEREEAEELRQNKNG